jgi:hypothetical protein
VDQAVFLGDVTDVKIRAGRHVLQARWHPGAVPPVGAETQLRIRAQKCVAIDA